MGMLRHRPRVSNVAVFSSLRNKKGGETLILKKKETSVQDVSLG
jgi:hypothetical protein